MSGASGVARREIGLLDLQPWMLLVPAVLSAGVVPLARRHPAVAWALWIVLALATLAAAVLFTLMVAFVQTVFGAGLALSQGDPQGSRGHVDLVFLAPWLIGAVVVTAGSGVALWRVHMREPTR